jgi:hypothetical protein
MAWTFSAAYGHEAASRGLERVGGCEDDTGQQGGHSLSSALS